MENKKKVLVIDDDHIVAEALKELLEYDCGFEACCCHDGSSALIVSQTTFFDVIIIDYQMPGMNGLEVARLMRKRFPDSFIIGFSARKMKEEFLQADADAFLSKPFSVKAFFELLSNKNGKCRNETIKIMKG